MRTRLVAFTLLLVAGAALPVLAASVPGISVNGEALQVTPPPYLDGGELMVPVRPLFERLGYAVQYDGARQQILLTRGRTGTRLAIGQKEVISDGRPGYLPAPVIVRDGRAFAPFPALAFVMRLDVRGNSDDLQLFTPVLEPPAEFVGPSYTARSGDLQLRLTLNQASYRQGEIVWAEASVYNGGAEAVPVVYGNGCMQVAHLSMDAPPAFFNSHFAAARGSLGRHTGCTMNIVPTELKVGDTLQAWYAWDTAAAEPGTHLVEAVFAPLPAPAPRLTGEVLLFPSR